MLELSEEDLLSSVTSAGIRAEVLAGNHGLEASKIMVARGESFSHLSQHPCVVYFNLNNEQAGLVSFLHHTFFR